MSCASMGKRTAASVSNACRTCTLFRRMDNGVSWSSSYPIIGKTLSEELAAGKSYMAAKYSDTSSYSNTFVEKLSDNSVLVLYNNLKYDDGDGLCHKAAFVRKITAER